MIAIILVNWNGHRDTIECLESLMRLACGDFVVMVVDNGSTDGSIKAITAWAEGAPWRKPEGAPWDRLPAERIRPVSFARLGPEGDIAALPPGGIALVEAGANLGFAGANNIGMRIARRDPRIRHFWLLNNDTITAPDAPDRMRAALAERPDVAILGARLMYYHAPDLVQGVGGYFKLWLARGGHLGFNVAAEDLPPLAEIERDMAYVMGASMFLPVATYDSIGPMSEDYFLYFEELDWAERLKRAKAGRQSVALDAVVYHKEGGSIGSSSLKRPSDTSLYFLARNLLRFFWAWHPALIAVAAARLLRDALGYLRGGDVRAARIVLLNAPLSIRPGSAR